MHKRVYVMMGMQELLIVFAVILLLFGATKLPELARSLGKASGEFKKARMESEKEITNMETGGKR
jgi:sec-independent protein translocase protein TatA